MKKRLISIILILACVVLMAGCGSDGNTAPAPDNGNSNAGTETPAGPAERADKTVFNSRIFSEIPSLDPQVNPTAYDLAVMYQIYDSFFEPIDGDYSNLKPCLVESYEVDEAAMNYTFHIRQGVKWQNGDDFTVDDAIFSVNRMRQSSVTAARIASITDVQKVDDTTFTISCSYPMPRLCALFSTASMSCVNKKLIEEYGDSAPEAIVGTGAYKLESWDSDKIVLTSFDEGWRGAPEIKTVNYYLITDANAAKIAYQQGDIDEYFCIAASEKDEFDADANRITPYTNATTDSLCFNTSKDGWTSNEDFRRACAYAIDRATVVDIASEGLYQVTDSIFTPGNSAHDDSYVYPYEYNPDKAKEILDEIGYDGASIRFTYCSAYPTSTGWATSIENYLRQVGINVEMEGADLAGTIDKFVNRDFDIACIEYGASFPDPLSSVYALYRSDGYYNAWCYTTEELDNSIIGIYGIVDANEQAKALQAVDQFAQSICLYVPTYQVGGFSVYPKNFVNSFTPEPMFGWARVCYAHWE